MARVQTLGPSLTVLTDLMVKSGGAAEYAVGSGGTLAYHAGATEFDHLALVDRRGRERRLQGPGHYHDVRLSPDGRRVAVVVGSASSHDVWVLDLDRGSFMRLSFEQMDDAARSRALWTSDGRRVLFQSVGRNLVLSRAADGTAVPDTVLRADFGSLRDWLPDGALVMERGGPAGLDIWSVQAETGAATALVATPFTESRPAVSPDGRWLAYTSNETGASEVYVMGLGGTGGRSQVSTGGGADAVWARDGRTIFYRAPRSLVAVPITLGRSLRFGQSTVLFVDSTTVAYDVLPNGEGFVVVRRELRQDAGIIVVHNWLAELRERLGDRK